MELSVLSANTLPWTDTPESTFQQERTYVCCNTKTFIIIFKLISKIANIGQNLIFWIHRAGDQLPEAYLENRNRKCKENKLNPFHVNDLILLTMPNDTFSKMSSK